MAEPCIEHTKNTPYGLVVVAGRRTALHVLAWENTRGRPRPEGHVIHHICRNKRCIEPTHLMALPEAAHLRLHTVGTRSIPADVAERIRAEYASLPRAKRRSHGPRKRTYPEARVFPGKLAELAAKYDITVPYLKAVVKGPRMFRSAAVPESSE